MTETSAETGPINIYKTLLANTARMIEDYAQSLKALQEAHPEEMARRRQDRDPEFMARCQALGTALQGAAAMRAHALRQLRKC